MHQMYEKNLDIYGDAPIPWSRALDQLDDVSAKKTYWLATARPDGRPHVAGVGAWWIDGKFYFTSGDGTRKSRNLAENPTCVISVALPTLDLAIEGTAATVTDEATLQHLAERYAAQGWPASVGEGAITAPTARPAPGRHPGISTS
jgi:general stress protein 26